jgi:unsaturated chondroitin disaccharide hydrolase
VNNRRLALKAADVLAKRFVSKGEYIQAWGRMDGRITETDPQLAKDVFYIANKGLAIIDCMMNLPLLFWATEQTGNSWYYDIAVKHADTTLRYFIRGDYSVYHAFRFDPESGKPLGGCNYCGYADESHWARGTAWAIYGFAIAYRYTKDERYLKASLKLSHKFLDSLTSSYIPTWDFRLNDGMVKNKDTSAAAIAVCGFMEILKYMEDEKLSEYSDKMLNELTDEAYTDYNPDCPGILKQSNGKMTYTLFGDYFYMEALRSKLYGMETFW